MVDPIQLEYNLTASETDAYGISVQRILGAPIGGQTNVPGVPGARMQSYQGGTIYFSQATGAHVAFGGIGWQYGNLGGPAGYGLPTSDEEAVPGVQGVRVTTFQGGHAIYWSPSTGPHAVGGPIGEYYNRTASETDAYGTNVQSILRAPTGDEKDVPDVPGARMQTFQGGTIYFSQATWGGVVYGDIAAMYARLGGPAGYGMPTSNEADVPGVPGVRVSFFGPRHAIYYSSSYGSHAVRDGIFDAYFASASKPDYYGTSVQKILRAPTGDEKDVLGVPGARMQTFQGGTIYWSQSINAHWVIGDIATRYASLAGPNGSLGLPTSDESNSQTGRVQYFQHGNLVWNARTGAVTVNMTNAVTSVTSPSITVSVAGSGSSAVFTVIGSNFQPNAQVTIRVADTAQHVITYTWSATAQGTLQAVLHIPVISGLPLYFSATDGRQDSSQWTGSLWSNTFIVTAP
jgi:uncharacterized protein with LGFP repeats